MNERIRELAHAAGLPTYNPEGIPTKLEKFAELIVRECASIIESQDVDPTFRHRMSWAMKEKFGVKE
jgi:hypothetical protein